MDFLRRIEDARFPLELHDEADIRNSIVLEAAELIEAQLPGVDAPPADASAIICASRRKERPPCPRASRCSSVGEC